MSEIKSEYYLPQHLTKRPLYKKLCEIIDYLIDKFYTPEIDQMRDQYDPLADSFNAEEFMTLIDGYEYRDMLFGQTSIEQISHMLTRIYNLKGTKKGLHFLMDLLGIQSSVYIWWELLRSHEQGTELWDEFAGYFLDYTPDDIKNCGLYFHFVDNNGILGQFGEELDEKLMELVNSFMWVCAQVSAISLLRNFYDRVVWRDHYVESSLDHITSNIYDSSSWRDSMDGYTEVGDYVTSAGSRLYLDYGFEWESNIATNEVQNNTRACMTLDTNELNLDHISRSTINDLDALRVIDHTEYMPDQSVNERDKFVDVLEQIWRNSEGHDPIRYTANNVLDPLTLLHDGQHEYDQNAQEGSDKIWHKDYLQYEDTIGSVYSHASPDNELTELVDHIDHILIDHQCIDLHQELTVTEQSQIVQYDSFSDNGKIKDYSDIELAHLPVEVCAISSTLNWSIEDVQ